MGLVPACGFAWRLLRCSPRRRCRLWHGRGRARCSLSRHELTSFTSRGQCGCSVRSAAQPPLRMTITLTWLILLHSELHIAVKPSLPTSPAHISQPTSLLPVWHRLPDKRDTDHVVTPQHLQIRRPLPRPDILLMHHHIHPAPTFGAIIGDPVRSADVPFFVVEGDKRGRLTVGLCGAGRFVVQGDDDAGLGVDAAVVPGEVRFECQRDQADGGILEDCEDMEGHSCGANHDGDAVVCGLRFVKIRSDYRTPTSVKLRCPCSVSVCNRRDRPVVRAGPLRAKGCL